MTLIIFKGSRDVNEIDSVVLIDESQIRSSKGLNLHAPVSVDVQVVQESFAARLLGGVEISGGDEIVQVAFGVGLVSFLSQINARQPSWKRLGFPSVNRAGRGCDADETSLKALSPRSISSPKKMLGRHGPRFLNTKTRIGALPTVPVKLSWIKRRLRRRSLSTSTFDNSEP